MKINGTIFSKPQQDQLKAITGTKYTQYNLDLSTQSGRDTLIKLCQASNQGKYITLRRPNSGDIYTLFFVAEGVAQFSRTSLIASGDIDALSIYTIICKSASAKIYSTYTPINGTTEKNTNTLSNVILFIED